MGIDECQQVFYRCILVVVQYQGIQWDDSIRLKQSYNIVSSKYPLTIIINLLSMTKGLKHAEYEFSVSIKCARDIYLKQPARFYISWKIIHQNQCKEIIADQYIQPNSKGELHFNNQLKVLVKLIFNKESNSFLTKKSMLCLNYILEDNPKESILGGLVTIDLAALASQGENKSVSEYFLQRSIFKKSVIALKLSSTKIKQEVMNSFNWESKDMNIDSLLDRTLEKGKVPGDKRIINTRKNINRIIKDGGNGDREKSNSTITNQSLRTENSTLESQLEQLRVELSNSVKSVKELQTENQALREFKQGVVEKGRQREREESEECTNLREENRYILNELEKVSIQLANREKEMSLLKAEYDKLRKKEKKRQKEREKEKEKGNEGDNQEQLCYLSSEIMRLHEELSNYRETEHQNNELKRQIQSITKERDETSALFHQLSNIRQNSLSSASINGIEERFPLSQKPQEPFVADWLKRAPPGISVQHKRVRTSQPLTNQLHNVINY